MSLDDFWQENKRWVLGCIAGLLVFLIARAFVSDASAKATKLTTSMTAYTQKELAAAQADRTRLDATLASLRAAMHAEVPKRYVLEGDPELFWTRTYSQVRGEMFDLAGTANVEFPENALAWPTPADAVQIRRGLIALSLVDHLMRNLIAAHRSVTEADSEAIGLRVIGNFTFTPDRARTDRRARKPEDPIPPEELLEEVRVGFKFEADNATVQRFLENCRDAARRVTLGGIKLTPGRRQGDPLTVTGELVSLSIQTQTEGG